MHKFLPEDLEFSLLIESVLSDSILSEVNDKELNKIVNHMSNLNSRAIEIRTSKRAKAHWETGWDQNYLQLKSGNMGLEEAVVPIYFTKQKFFRFKKKIYNLNSWELLSRVHIACLDFVARKASQFYSHDFIIEVGSGSGQNILEL